MRQNAAGRDLPFGAAARPWRRSSSCSFAVVGHRTDFIDQQPTLAMLALGLAFAFSAVIAAIVAFGAIWRDARKGFGAAVLGLVIGAALIAYPAVLFSRLFSLPAIADVTTDPDDVPAFLGVDWDHSDPTPLQTAAQIGAYPGVVPHVYAADPPRVFDEVAQLVQERGWNVVLEEPPVVAAPIPQPVPPAAGDGVAGADAAPAVAETPVEPAPTLATPGYVVAVARTAVVGFREDVAIRIMAGPDGTIVDMRSASRVFAHDFGSDARRIESFLSDLDERLPLVTPG